MMEVDFVYVDRADRQILGFKDTDHPEWEGHSYTAYLGDQLQRLQFQKGTVEEKGVNGLTEACLLAILIHRLNVLQRNNPKVEQTLALKKLQEALGWFEQRDRGLSS